MSRIHTGIERDLMYYGPSRGDDLNKPIRIRVGMRIRRARNVAGLTQSATAERIGCSNSHLSLIESGKQMPSLPLLIDAALVLRTTVGELVDG